MKTRTQVNVQVSRAMRVTELLMGRVRRAIPATGVVLL